jgi:hypothetical protein
MQIFSKNSFLKISGFLISVSWILFVIFLIISNFKFHQDGAYFCMMIVSGFFIPLTIPLALINVAISIIRMRTLDSYDKFFFILSALVVSYTIIFPIFSSLYRQIHIYFLHL